MGPPVPKLNSSFLLGIQRATLWQAESSEEIILIAKAITLNTKHDIWIKSRRKEILGTKKPQQYEVLKCSPACLYVVFCTVTIKMTRLFYTFHIQATCFDFVALGESLEKPILLKALPFLLLLLWTGKKKGKKDWARSMLQKQSNVHVGCLLVPALCGLGGGLALPLQPPGEALALAVWTGAHW